MLESITLSVACRLLAVPLEIRQIIYIELFQSSRSLPITARPPPDQVEDENDTTSWPADRESFAITHHNLHAQLLATCKQVHGEGLPFLYSHRYFDLTARESLKLFLENIGPKTFCNIQRIVLDWDALQDFAWSMPKPGYAEALSGLQVVELATWRNRHIDTTGTRWRNVKGYERMMCQSASDIIDRHPNLSMLVEEQFRRKSSVVPVAFPKALDELAASRQDIPDTGPRRIKWRFLALDNDRRDGEVVINIDTDLNTLRDNEDETTDPGFQLPMIDPF